MCLFKSFYYKLHIIFLKGYLYIPIRMSLLFFLPSGGGGKVVRTIYFIPTFLMVAKLCHYMFIIYLVSYSLISGIIMY